MEGDADVSDVSSSIRCIGLFLVFLPAVVDGLTGFYFTLSTNRGAQTLHVFCIANSCPGKHFFCVLFFPVLTSKLQFYIAPILSYVLKGITTFQ